MARQIRKKSGTGVYHVMGRFWILTQMDTNPLVTVMLRHSFKRVRELPILLWFKVLKKRDEMKY